MSEPFSTPGDLLALSGSYWRACALHAGVMLDVFTPLADKPLTAGEAAAATGCDQRAMGMLLNALCAMGLMDKTGETFAPAALARGCLVRDAPRPLSSIIRHHHRLMESWARLPESVRTGCPTRERSISGEGREDFLLGMFNMASAIAPTIAGLVDLSGRQSLLDLGGGPGTYAAHFCLANPGLHAAVFDLPESKPFAESVLGRLGAGERVRFIAGDFHADPIPGTYDAVWISHVLHAESPEACGLLLAKTAKTLRPGGLLLVHEFILNDSMDGPEFPALFSLNMLLGTKGGQSYGEGQIRRMMEEAGGQNVKRLDFTGPNGSGIMSAVVG